MRCFCDSVLHKGALLASEGHGIYLQDLVSPAFLLFRIPVCMVSAAPLGVGLGGRLDGGKAVAAAQPAGFEVPQASSAPGASTGSSGAAASKTPHHQQAPAMTQTQGGDGDGAQCASSASAAAGPRPTDNLRGPDAFSARAAAAGAATADTAGGGAPLQQPSAPTGHAAPSAADEQLPGASGDDTASGWTVGPTERPNEGREKQHYWGQALQHLDREVCTPDGSQELSIFLWNSLERLRRCSSRTFSPGLCPFVLRLFSQCAAVVMSPYLLLF